MSSSKARSYPVCALAELAPGSARGIALGDDPEQADVFVVHHDGDVFAYRNQCPHTGGPLEWVPDQFLDLDGRLIQCATHDALFRIEDGRCIAGPCAGDALTPVPVRIVDGQVTLEIGDSHDE